MPRVHASRSFVPRRSPVIVASAGVSTKRALLTAARACFANRPAAAPEIVAARRLLAELF